MATSGGSDFHLSDAVDLDGLAPEYDAFNDDTFGDVVEEWAESTHEQLAELTEDERLAMQSSKAFFEFDDANDDDGLLEALEPESDTNGDLGHSLSQLKLERRSPGLIMPPIASPANAGAGAFQDPAILNLMTARPPASVRAAPAASPPPGLASPSRGSWPNLGDAPGHPQLPMSHLAGAPQPHVGPQMGAHTLQELEREMHSQSRPQPAPPMPSFSVPPPRYPPPGGEGGYRGPPQPYANQSHYSQSGRRPPMHHHPHPPRHHYHQPAPHPSYHGHAGPPHYPPNHYQPHHHNQHPQPGGFYDHRPRFHASHQGEYRRSRNPDDEKNDETFGSDFVEDHMPHAGRSTGRFNPRGDLITPGHVHVLGILRGQPASAYEYGEGYGRYGSESQVDSDDFSGLMTSREKQWIINIQLAQLKCENPFLDDYYYTVFNQKREMEEEERLKEIGREEEADENEIKQLKRDEEGPQLLLKSESTDRSKEEYAPVQFTNSLGKLQAHTVKAPKKNIDLGGVNTELQDGPSPSQKDSRNYKSILMELERIYSNIIEVEDNDKKLSALPTNTEMRRQVEVEREMAMEVVAKALSKEAKLKKYLTVRKGKALLKRCLTLLSDSSMHLVLTTLFQIFPTAIKRDRDDKLLLHFWPRIKAYFSEAPTDVLINYMTLLNAGAKAQSPAPGSKVPTPSTFNSALTHPLGVSVIALGLQKLSEKKSQNATQSQQITVLTDEVGAAVAATQDIPAPLEKINLDIALLKAVEMKKPLGRLAQIGSLVMAS